MLTTPNCNKCSNKEIIHKTVPMNNMKEPKVIGPGVWMSLHILAMNAHSSAEKQDFMSYITFLQKHFPCSLCKQHINDYIQNNPINIELDNIELDNIELFRWTWKFHNNVNIRLKKSYIGWETAYALYI